MLVCELSSSSQSSPSFCIAFELVAYWHIGASYVAFDYVSGGLLPEQFVMGETRSLNSRSVQSEYMK